MHEKKWLAEQFEASRAHLRAVAYRILGSRAEAEDAVQEAWLRLGRSDRSEIDNLTGRLTTVVARVCLDVLRARKGRREEPTEAFASDDDPEHHALNADLVGLALLVVLKRLAPAERVAFVLHDMFDLPFDEFAPIVGRSPVATRQLASGARRRVQGARSTPMTISPGSGRSPVLSGLHRATATWMRCWQFSIPRSYSGPIGSPRRWVELSNCGAERPSP